MTEKLDVAKTVSELSDKLDMEPSEFNSRVARSVMLYNQNPSVQNTQLRFRQAKPIKVAISVVNSLLRKDPREYDRLGSEGVKRNALIFYKRFFNSDFQYARNVIDKYYPRMVDYGMVESFGTNIVLADDYEEKILHMLAESRQISTGNTYFKAMAITTASASITEKYPWGKYSEEIATDAFEAVKESGLLKVSKAPKNLQNIHIDPLHNKQKVDFYFDNKEMFLGIPATSPMPDVGDDYVGLDRQTLTETQVSEINDAIRELAELPIISSRYILENYDPMVFNQIRKLANSNPENFPLVRIPVEEGIISSSIYISKRRIESLRKISNGLLFSTLSLEDEPIWSIAPVLFDEVGPDDISTVNKVLDILVKEREVATKDTNTPVEKKILGILWDRGQIIQYDEKKRKYIVNDEKILSKINSILNLWKIPFIDGDQ